MKRIKTETFVAVSFYIIALILIAISSIELISQTHTVIGSLSAMMIGFVFVFCGIVVENSNN